MQYERRINLNTIVEYKPFEKLENKFFYIKIKYLTDKEEDLIFDDSKKRDNFLKCLDDNLILK